MVKALENRGAALIANHGMVAIGTTMQKTMHNTALVERSAKIIWGSKQLGGIFPLPEKVNENFASVYPYMRSDMSDGRIRARLAELGLTLHGPHPPHDPLDAVVVHDGVARTSGQLPRIAGELTCLGRLGDTVTVEEGAEAAAVCALNALAVLEAGARLARPHRSASSP